MKFYHQHDERDCGPASLCMIASYYGKYIPIQYLREKSYLSKDGVSLLSLSEASEEIGLETITAKLSLSKIIELKNNLPCVLHWNQRHFVVIEKIKKNILNKKHFFYISDPAHGKIILNEKNFCNSWLSDNNLGVAMFFKPSEKFENFEIIKQKKIDLSFILKYLKPYLKQISLMFVLLLIGSILTLILPFLTQNLIDKGVNAKNLNLIQLILLAQLCVYIGYITLEIIRNWLLLYVGTKLSITIISEFLKKLLKLPLKYFDTKSTPKNRK
jgi:ATP-binding cassette, subfamily B, bacterial